MYPDRRAIRAPPRCRINAGTIAQGEPLPEPAGEPRKPGSGEGGQETAPTSPTPAQLPVTGPSTTSTPRNGRGLAVRSRLWLVRPAYPAIRQPSIAVSGGEPATSGSSGLYGHSIRTPWACQAPFVTGCGRGDRAWVASGSSSDCQASPAGGAESRQCASCHTHF
jgi:hypothetical protein